MNDFNKDDSFDDFLNEFETLIELENLEIIKDDELKG